MKILHIWKNTYPWDVRVEKISKELIRDGHAVHLVCKNEGTQPVREQIDEIEIHRLPGFSNTIFNPILSIVAFFNPFWLWKIYSVADREKVNLLLVRDLPLAITSIWVGRLLRIPVIFDMAENYPSMWKDHVENSGANFFNRITKNPAMAVFMENYAIHRVDHVIVVIEESKQRLISKGLSGDRISIVSNTPVLEKDTGQHSSTTREDKSLKILYVGSINGGRGLDTLIKSIPEIALQINDFQIIIAGDGENLPALRELADTLRVNNYVTFLGWVDSDKVMDLIDHCDICTVPHDVTEFINTTIPNKLFDYMACKKPVIVSNAAPLKRIVEETGCGLSFETRNPKDFATKVKMLADESLRTVFGQSGYNAVQSQYNWGVDAAILKKIVNNL